jgi:hypothetical protein
MVFKVARQVGIKVQMLTHSSNRCNTPISTVLDKPAYTNTFEIPYVRQASVHQPVTEEQTDIKSRGCPEELIAKHLFDSCPNDQR